MVQDYWFRQTPDKPLFPNMLWSRPENRRHAGKLLIVGGNGYEFQAPANAYGDALDAGVGDAKVILPDSMKKVVHDIFPEAEFAPSTPSGSLARTSLAQILDWSQWADGVLLAGDIGRNSETAIVLETLLDKFTGQLTLAKDTANYVLDAPGGVLARPDTLAVITTAQLQRLANGAKYPVAFTSDMDLVRFVDWLHEFTTEHQLHIITKHLDTIVIASGGQVSTTKFPPSRDAWRVRTAAHAATWWLQNPTKPFEALTTSVAT
jgi:NAD(P)H-hydrate repair Nnr-like enzyme with NAD(P)H-hydrate dehydratase domain